MYIRRRSFFEICFPLTVVFFIGVSTIFLSKIGGFELRWVFDCLLFLYLFLNRKCLIHINHRHVALLLFYFAWCVSTTAWSEMPLLSFSKSVVFAFNIIIMLSAGSLWVIKFGYARSLDYLFLLLLIVMLSGIAGKVGNNNLTHLTLYGGLSGNSNTFGSMVAMTMPLILLKIYQGRQKKLRCLIWIVILIIAIHFLLLSCSRTALAIFLCSAYFFFISLSLSKKIIIGLSAFFFISLLLIMMPTSYLESIAFKHIFKHHSTKISHTANSLLQSREMVWHKSYEQAKKGGLIGGGFFVSIGKTSSNDQYKPSDVSREKGNAQFAIVEETGLVGLCFYAAILISFFWYIIPFYLRLNGSDKVAMGITLGAIIGILLQSIAEDSWDSSAGQEFIYFWTLVGVIYGMIYLKSKFKHH